MEKEKTKRAAKAQPETQKLKPGLPKKEDGSLDWRKLVSPGNLLLSQPYFARKGIDVDTLEESEKEKHKVTVEDSGLIIMLAGIREIAQARGVKSVIYDLVDRTDCRSVVKCTVIFTPNEDEPYEVTTCGIANSSVENTAPDFFTHADAIASNRSYCRAVRNNFNISSVSYEEINPNEKKEEVKSAPSPYTALAKTMEEGGFKDEDIKELMKDYQLGPKFDGTAGSLEKAEAFTLISIIKKKQ